MATMPSILFDVVQLEVARISLRPGDVLVVRCPNPLPREVSAALKTNVEAVLPHGCKCLVMPTGFDLSVIEKAGDDVQPDAVTLRS